MSEDAQQAAPFRSRTVVLIIAVAVIAFAGFLLLIAFAPQFQSGHDGRGHALSTSGNGYAGLVELTDYVSGHAQIVKRDEDLATRDLLVVTPEFDGKQADLVVIGGDLASNIGEISRTEIVFRGGVKYDPAALRKSAEGGVK